MSLIIYTDPVIDEKTYYDCPDDNPQLHEQCKMNALYCRQHNSFLSEQIVMQERLIERLTHVNVAQEITLRRQTNQHRHVKNKLKGTEISFDESQSENLKDNIREIPGKELIDTLMKLDNNNPWQACSCEMTTNDGDIVTMSYGDY